MKEGWEYKKFGDLVFFDKRFKGIPRDEQKKVVSFKHVSAETLKGMSVDGGCIKLLSTGLFSGFTTEEIAGDNLNEGEVVTIPTGGNANLKYYKGKFVDSGNILCVAKDDNIYLKFLHYKLLEQNEYIESCFKGTGIHHPFMPDIWNVMIPVPDITEQQRIVNLLDAAFVKIESMKANAEKSLNEAKVLFQASLKEMLEPKEGWEEKNLGDCFFSINNGANIKQAKGAKGIPITRIETLSNDKFNRERLGYADILDASPYTSYILNDGDILMSHINSMKYLGRAVRYSKKEDETIIHGMNLLRLVPKNNVLSSFLIYQFYTAFFRNQIATISHQSVNQASFNTTNLKSLKLIFPSLSEQQSIVTTLDSLKSKVDRLQENYDKISQECDALKQAILRQVFE